MTAKPDELTIRTDDFVLWCQGDRVAAFVMFALRLRGWAAERPELVMGSDAASVELRLLVDSLDALLASLSDGVRRLV